jgi:hypothetical protein
VCCASFKGQFLSRRAKPYSSRFAPNQPQYGGGWAKQVKSKETRRTFLTDVAKLLELNGLHGVDYNWEYPRGKEEWDGLATYGPCSPSSAWASVSSSEGGVP